jgi:hypothetical protein
MFQVPWPPEIGVRALPTQHKVDFQHSTFLLLTYCRCLFKVCVENYQNLERSTSYAFSIVYVCKLGGQNGCARRTRNLESITQGLMKSPVSQLYCMWFINDGHSFFWCWEFITFTLSADNEHHRGFANFCLACLMQWATFFQYQLTTSNPFILFPNLVSKGLAVNRPPTCTGQPLKTLPVLPCKAHTFLKDKQKISPHNRWSNSKN